jgi:hypothetical protein
MLIEAVDIKKSSVTFRVLRGFCPYVNLKSSHTSKASEVA